MIKRVLVKDVATYDKNGVIIDDITKVNYIYGANGSGKTTISNLLANPEKESFNKCAIEWNNDIVEKVFVYNKKFRERNF